MAQGKALKTVLIVIALIVIALLVASPLLIIRYSAAAELGLLGKNPTVPGDIVLFYAICLLALYFDWLAYRKIVKGKI